MANKPDTLRRLRISSQLFFLFLWLALFLAARGPINELIRTDFFLMTDPLVALITIGAAQVLVPTMLFSLAMVLFGLVFGRAFCGWICPLGTLIDGLALVFRPRPLRFSDTTHQRMLRWKYYILAAVAAAALVSSQWLFVMDPLVMLFRGLATGLYPVYSALLPKGSLPEAMATVSTPVSFLPLALLLLVLGLTAIAPRFYCRYLCPLGAFYGLLARIPFFRRRVNSSCDGCKDRKQGKQCRQDCRMQAVPEKHRHTLNHECIRCMTGRSSCHAQAIRFPFRAKGREKPDRPVDMGRRGFLTATVAGLGLGPAVSGATGHREDPMRVIRPPMVIEENTFLDQCVRCGMCVQACPTQTLQLTHLESGLVGLWSPAITPRVGGCIANCNACSLVCASEAIPMFGKSNSEKWAVKMGTAVFEAGRCISYTSNQGCSKCIKICPTQAVILDRSPGAHPVRPAGVDYGRCMGCGLCETECLKIVFGEAAIITYAHGRGQPTVLK